MDRGVRPGTRWRLLIVPAIAAMGFLATTRAAHQPSEEALGPFPAISRPSDFRELAVAVRGRVDRVLVKPGDEVSPGDQLLMLEDAVQRRTIELSRIASTDESNVRNAMLLRDHWAEEVRLTTASNAQGGASENEVRDAKLKLGQSEIALDSARLRLTEAGIELERELARLDEMRVVSPIRGVVLEVHKRQGETADEQTKVLTIVATDPLWLEVNVPTREAMRLRVGDPARVRWQDLDEDSEQTGHVIFISPTGHAGARQVQVRIELANERGLPSGLHGNVMFVSPSGAGGKRAGP